MSVIQSVGKRRLMALRLDDDADPAAVKRIESALETLADPVERFEWGLLAPELTEAEATAYRNDPVLSTFSENPRHDAAAAYERICEADNSATRAHNVGVLKLVQSVAATEEAQKGTPDDISDDLECVELWKMAYKNLRLAFGSDKFWMRQRLRGKAYQDQRLDAERIKRIQTGIFKEMVEPVGAVIRQALLDRHGKVAKAYVNLIRSSGFEEKFVDDVLSDVYQPLADRVEKNVAGLRYRLESTGESVSELRALLESFKTEIAADLDVMLEVGDLPGYAEEHARDSSSDFLRDLGIASWNKANDQKLAAAASELAAKYVDSHSLREKIDGDLEFLKTATPVDKHAEDLQQKVLSSLQAGQLSTAIRRLEALLEYLISKGRGNDEQAIAVRSILSATLYNHAVQIAAPEKVGEMKKLLKRALEVEPDSGDRAVIRQTMSQLPNTGCLIAILQLMIGAVLMGLVGGGLHACSQ